jgi:hypothetical protein
MRVLQFVLSLVFMLVAGVLLQSVPAVAEEEDAQAGLEFALYLPAVGREADGATSIPPTTVVINDTALQDLVSISDAGTLTFTGTAPVVNALDVNDIVVGGVSTNSPQGFLRKVESVSASGGQVVIETGPATLEEAIQSGEVNLSAELSPADIASVQLAEGVQFLEQRSLAEGEFYYAVDNVVVYDGDGNLNTHGDQIRANGHIALTPRFDWRLSIQSHRLEHLVLSVPFEETLELTFEVAAAVAPLERKVDLAHWSLHPITTFVGPVPVVVVPVLTISAGINGEASVGVTARVIQNATARAGIEYTNDAWRAHGDLTTNFDFIRPTPFGAVKIKGYLGPQFSFLLYGVAGAYVNTSGYLELDANTSNRPWWQFYAGLEARTGVRMELLSVRIESPEIDALGYRQSLASAPFEANSSVTFVRVERNGGDPDWYDVVWVTNNESGRGTTQFAVTRQRGDEVPYILGFVNPQGDSTYRFTDRGTGSSGGVPQPQYKYRVVEFQGQPYPAFQLGPVRLGEAWP